MLQAWATERAASLLGHDAVTIDKTGLGAVIGRGRRSYYAEHLFDLGLYRAKLGFVGHRLRQKLNGEFGSEMARRYRLRNIAADIEQSGTRLMGGKMFVGLFLNM